LQAVAISDFANTDVPMDHGRAELHAELSLVVIRK